MKYYKKMVGERIFLSPIHLEDALQYTEWLNQMEITVNLSNISADILTLEREKELLQCLAKENYNFAIIDQEKELLIGNCGYLNVDMINRKADLGIFIGNKDYWNRGYGQEAINLLLDFGFHVCNFNSVMLTVKEFNHRAIRCYEKCGFQKIGMRREAVIFGDQKYGVILMDLLASEFKINSIEKILSANFQKK